MSDDHFYLVVRNRDPDLRLQRAISHDVDVETFSNFNVVYCDDHDERCFLHVSVLVFQYTK